MLLAKVHGREVESALTRLAAERGYTISKAMKMSARRIAANLTYETEPRGFDEAAHTAGKNAIRRDIKKVFATATDVYGALLKENKGLAVAFYGAIKAWEIDKARGFLQRSIGVFRDVELDNLSPGLHQLSRGSGGRVVLRMQSLIVAAGQLDTYLALIEARSGLAASAWAECATKLGGTREIPAWKKGKHGVNKDKSLVTDNSTHDNAIISMENFTPYIDRVCDERKMARVCSREEEVLKDLLERALEAAVRKSGFHL